MLEQVINTLNDFNDQESDHIQKVQSEYSNTPTKAGRSVANHNKKNSFVPSHIPEVEMEESHSMGGGYDKEHQVPIQGDSQGLVMNAPLDENEMTKLFDQI